MKIKLIVLIKNIFLRRRYEQPHRRIGHHLITMALFTEAVTYLGGCKFVLHKETTIAQFQNAVGKTCNCAVVRNHDYRCFS